MKRDGFWANSAPPPAIAPGPKRSGRRSPSRPRAVDARLAIALLDRDLLDRQQINPDRHQMTELLERADRFLEDSIRLAQSEKATAELLLARARLDLTPNVGKPQVVKELCDRVAGSPGLPASRIGTALSPGRPG